MRVAFCSLALMMAAALVTTAQAGNGGGVMQSAETINRGNFKLMIHPMYGFGQNGADDEVGIAARGGYGFTDRFDAEAKVAFYENHTILGADVEFWLLKDAGLDFSVIGGAHSNMADGNGLDTWGIDLAPIASGHLSDNVEPYLALDVSFETINDAPPLMDDTFNTMHLVPGAEFRMSEEADLLVEFGLGMNDESSEYASAGVAFYLR